MEELRKTPLTSHNLENYVSQIDCIRGQSVFLNPAELPERIIAIGDIHGDLEALFSILLKSGIIDINGRWVANNTFLVQTGDIFDKGRLKPPINSVGQPQNIPGYMRSPVPYDIIDKYGNTQTITKHHNFEFGEVGDELVIIKFLTDLHVQATDPSNKFGNSRVLLCIGNHEFMNTSQFDYYSDLPYEEVQRILQEGTFEEIKSEIEKRGITNPNGQPFIIPPNASPEILKQILLPYVGIHNIVSPQYAHPMDAILFGGPDFPIRREIFRHGRGYLARKLACILNAIVVVGDFIFSHGGINSINLNTITHISEIQDINDILHDYLIGNPTNPIDIEKYFINSKTSILWNRNLGKENGLDRLVCLDTLELIKDNLDRPNLNIVVGHDVQATCIDPKADANLNLPRVRNSWNRTNSDGTIDKCVILPTVWCNEQIYRIDTGISRMNASPDYRTPNEGHLNSLIITLNPDGSKRSVQAMNGILGLQSPVRKD